VSATDQPFDVVTTGRISVDLYPEQVGVPLAEVQSFAKSLGGTATNVAVAAARLGCRTALVTRVGEDPFGAYVRAEVARFGVDARWVGTDPQLRTPLAFCEAFPPDHFPLLFYREPKAPDMNLAAGDFDLDAVRAARLLWATGTGLSDEPSRGALLTAMQARAAAAAGGSRPITVLDLDYRPMFWADPCEAGERYREALRHATVAVGNREEVEVAVGTSDPDEAAQELLALGVELAVVKRGPEGTLARTASERVEVEPIRLEVVCGLGAGDAFGGALCHGLLSGWDVERIVRYANAAGAVVASRLGCADDMPTAEDVEAALCSA
jgi:5-dehydro-2-deoxygluconokinase